MGSPAGRGEVGEASQRKTQWGEVIVGCGKGHMVAESRAGVGAVFSEDH